MVLELISYQESLVCGHWLRSDWFLVSHHPHSLLLSVVSYLVTTCLQQDLQMDGSRQRPMATTDKLHICLCILCYLWWQGYTRDMDIKHVAGCMQWQQGFLDLDLFWGPAGLCMIGDVLYFLRISCGMEE